MNILFILPSLARAGAELQTVDLINGLSDRNHNVDILVFDRPFDLQNDLSSKVTLHRFMRRSRLDRNLIKRIASVFDERDIHVIVAVLEYSVLLASLARRKSRSKPPIVASLHGLDPPHIKAALQDRFIYRWLFKRIEHVVFVCATQRDVRSHGLPWLLQKSSVIYNGIDERKFRDSDFRAAGLAQRESLNIPTDSFVIGCIAQFRPEKKHDLLVEAFARLDGSPYLLLAGDGPCREETTQLVTKLGVDQRVFFLGNVPDSRPAIAASNITVLASRTESFSMAMLESLAMGVPMVASRVGGMHEAVIDGETGRLFPSGDVDSLRSCMQFMLDHPEKVTEMGELGASLVRERFSRSKMLLRSEELLQSQAQCSTDAAISR